MTIGGVSMILILGVINFLLVIMQVAGGLRWVEIPFGIHRKTGILLAVTASLHGLLAIAAG